MSYYLSIVSGPAEAHPLLLSLMMAIVTVSLCAQEVSTALGYALHMVALLSKILQVPLRYFPELVGSRSKLRDDVMPHLGTANEFPL